MDSIGLYSLYKCYKNLGEHSSALQYIELAYNAHQENDRVAMDYAQELFNGNNHGLARLILEKILKRSNFKPAQRLLEKLNKMN